MPKGRQVEEAALNEVIELLGELPVQRDLLIEALHLIQDSVGHLSARHLVALASHFRLSQAEVYEVATFYHHFDVVKEHETAPPQKTIRVCDGLSCAMAGAEDLITALNEKYQEADIRVQRVPCIGCCGAAPAGQVGKYPVDQATPEKVEEILKAKETLFIPAYEKLEAYKASGGYKVLEKIQKGQIDRQQVMEVMSSSGLRGLGGAGFPAGRKWQLVSSHKGPRLMTVNGDEGEPGTFKDRYWLERHPHKMLEGAQIAAHIVGCDKIYIYMRDEYPGVLEILKTEIAAIEKMGMNLVPMEVRRGAGAYICGEESAMIESIEGKRGLPRHRPPYIAEKGLFDKPTLNHNVETLLWVPEIIENGAEWFSSKGWNENHNGLRSYSVSGRVKSPGVKIAPAGIPLERLIEDYCDGMADGHKLKAFFPGGASGGVFPAYMSDMALDFGSFEPHGGFIGSHAIVILSDKDSIRDAVLNTMKFFKHESCGQCTPCRSGTQKLSGMLEKSDGQKDLYNDLITVMSDSSICGLGQAAGNCVKHLMKYFPEEMA